MKTSGLDKAFDTTFERGESEEKSLSPLNLSNEELVSIEKSPTTSITLENKDYVKSELKVLIDHCQTLVTNQVDNLKDDARPSAIMAVADLIRTARDLLSELNTMDKTENDLNIRMKNSKQLGSLLPGGVIQPDSITISLTGSEMVRKILEFNKGSELHAIDTTFSVEEE
jgi:hypothetical protein